MCPTWLTSEPQLPVYAANKIESTEREDVRLRCRHCGEIFIPPLVCPSCRGFSLRPRGVGAGAMEVHLKTQFPTLADIFRLDSDAAPTPAARKSILSAFGKAKKPAILVATRMALLQELPPLDLVALPAFDQMGAVPDFRADEQTVRILLQLRRTLRTKGHFIVQTWHKDRPLLSTALNGDLPAFAKQELAMRETFRWPPFCRVAKITVTGKTDTEAAKAAKALAKKLASIGGLSISEPTPAFIPRIKNQYRWVILLKWNQAENEERNIETAIARTVPQKAHIDVSPDSLL